MLSLIRARFFSACPANVDALEESRFSKSQYSAEAIERIALDSNLPQIGGVSGHFGSDAEKDSKDCRACSMWRKWLSILRAPRRSMLSNARAFLALSSAFRNRPDR